jgi:PAS domain S-box-containing protein
MSGIAPVKLTLSDSHNPTAQPDPLSDRQANRRVRNWALFAAGGLLYWALVTTIPALGGENILFITPFFVGAAGYFLGFTTGATASVIAIVVHTLALNGAGHPGPFATAMFHPAAHVGILLLGPAAGRLRSRVRRLEDELRGDIEDERELRDADFPFRPFFENTREVLWLATPDRRRLAYVSPAFAQVFGRNPESLRDRPSALLELVHPQDRSAFAAMLRKTPGEESRLTYRISRPDGELRWIETRTFAIEGKKRDVRFIAGISCDVTDNKRAAVTLENSEHKNHGRADEIEERLRLFVEHSPAAVAMFDGDIRYVMANRKWLEIYGLDDADVVGRKHDDVYPETPEHWKKACRRCLAGAVERRDDDRIVRGDGSVDWVKWEAHPWRKADSQIGGIIVFTEIVTEQWRSREQLRRSERQYRFLVDHMPDTITELDPEGNILFANRTASGQPMEEVVGTSIYAQVPENRREEFRRCVAEAVVTRSPRDCAASLHTASGPSSWAFRVVPVEEHGMVVRLLVIGTDVSASKRTESRRLRSEARHGGAIEHDVTGDNTAGDRADGATIELTPPLAEERVTDLTPRQLFPEPSQGKETVLVAEDEPPVRTLICEVLEGKGYRVLLASNGEEALRVTSEHAGRIGLLITDIVMPGGMNGREMAAELKAKYPALKVLYISGYIGKASVKIAELDGSTSFLTKPFSPEALARKIRLLLDTPTTSRSSESFLEAEPHHPPAAGNVT